MNVTRPIILTFSMGLCFGCDDSTAKEKVADAKQEAREGVAEAKEELKEAKKELEDAKEAAEKQLEGAEADAAGDQERGRFEALKDETDAAFVARAKKRIETIDGELEGLDDAVRKSPEFIDVEKKLAEARKDLAEFKGDKLLDDGKLGVTTAINAAERKLDAAKK
ncbi:MAG: hypothetical protein ACE37F_12440 [Nannocystaceae bacterium]|nr:hypothetical protein [bacterium]